MSSTMRAARYYGRRDIRVESIPVPQVRDDQCLVEIEWCGICGSDLHEYMAGPIGVPPKEHPHPRTGTHVPVTLGHEFCGRIKSAPPGSKFHEGQAVMVDPHSNCRECYSCTNGNDHMCHSLAFMGGSAEGGGLSEYVAMEEGKLHAIPDNLSIDDAALIEPLVVAHHAIKSATVPLAGSNVLILGGGPIGIALAIVLKAHGAKSLILSEPMAKRQEQSISLVDKLIDPRKDNVGNLCREFTDGKGVDIAFDCAGVQAGIEAAFDALAHGGIYLSVAIWETPMTIPFRQFFLKEIKVLSSCTYNEQDFREVMELIAKSELKDFGGMITSRIQLEDVVEKGFEELVQRMDYHVKILISPKSWT